MIQEFNDVTFRRYVELLFHEFPAINFLLAHPGFDLRNVVSYIDEWTHVTFDSPQRGYALIHLRSLFYHSDEIIIDRCEHDDDDIPQLETHDRVVPTDKCTFLILDPAKSKEWGR